MTVAPEVICRIRIGNYDIGAHQSVSLRGADNLMAPAGSHDLR
jgi:hypothetical protein